ncbi:substrate-binding domain-containing protein [Prevotella melaninogenica]|uniref:substrate-binding domain-containing protein n=1 Tax=Prevotella melaninogenica TaxID=28132 RepID=UPI001BAD1A5E|nr:substrate-binding domain-containing protein [Prevotella melaninogenica]QUB56187.1 substrate-binding domain-containing protein [Prevotella melaninogenica]QUB58779.1 substrate-binding domain-containing protein [Prevotella melaninogenica]
MQMKQWLYILIFTLLFSACSDNNVKKYVIGVSQCSEDIWRDKLNDELIMSTYQHDNVSLKFASANDNDKLQKQQIEQFIKEGVNLLIVSPNQIHTISSVIDKAYDAGIPVILFDRKTDSKKYTAFIGADNYEAGHEMGLFIAHQLGGKGNVVEIGGLKGSSPAIERDRGFTEALKAYPDIKIVGRYYTDWQEERAAVVMDSILAQGIKIDYVFGQNDRIAAGARKLAMKRGEKAMKFVGIDALPVAGGGMEDVRDGRLVASYIYPTRGDLVMQLALNILEKKPFHRDNYLKGTLVTIDNANALLLQNEEIMKQTARLQSLHGKVDNYLAQYNHQKVYFLLFSIIVILVIGILVYAYRSIVTRHRIEEETVTAKLQFFTNISHELRTPLTLIADPVDYIIRDSNLNAQQRDMLQIVQRNVSVLMRLVGEILDFRKVQNGKMKLHLSDFDLIECMQQWIGLFTVSAQKKNISLQLEAPKTIPMRADHDKLERICYNLLTNAMKYTPNGGKITFAATVEGDKVKIEVSDNGIGIAADEQAYIFNRFYQAKNAGQGTGIGLALVKAFTDLHHGEATVESKEGEGSRFTIVLPLYQAGELSTSKSQQPYSPVVEISSTEEVPNQARHIDDLVLPDEAARPEVLIIDDNSDIRSYLRTALSSTYKVSEAVDGKSGLEMARRIVPDLVISDIMMPVMDGLEFCSQLKQDKAISHIPVILLTARSLDEQRAEGYKHGADAYIAKPFSLELLLSRIDNLIQSRKKLSQMFSNTDENGVFEKLSNETDKTFVTQLRKIIQENLGNSEFNVERIGDEIGLSRVQLYRKVKALTGHSPVEMLRKARLMRARHLLRTTEKSVSEVAYSVGFSTPSYFSKCYKDEFGESPKK